MNYFLPSLAAAQRPSRESAWNRAESPFSLLTTAKVVAGSPVAILATGESTDPATPLLPGMLAIGDNLALGARVLSVDGPAQVTLSAPAVISSDSTPVFFGGRLRPIDFDSPLDEPAYVAPVRERPQIDHYRRRDGELAWRDSVAIREITELYYRAATAFAYSSGNYLAATGALFTAKVDVPSGAYYPQDNLFRVPDDAGIVVATGIVNAGSNQITLSAADAARVRKLAFSSVSGGAGTNFRRTVGVFPLAWSKLPVVRTITGHNASAFAVDNACGIVPGMRLSIDATNTVYRVSAVSGSTITVSPTPVAASIGVFYFPLVFEPGAYVSATNETTGVVTISSSAEDLYNGSFVFGASVGDVGHLKPSSVVKDAFDTDKDHYARDQIVSSATLKASNIFQEPPLEGAPPTPGTDVSKVGRMFVNNLFLIPETGNGTSLGGMPSTDSAFNVLTDILVEGPGVESGTLLTKLTPSRFLESSPGNQTFNVNVSIGNPVISVTSAGLALGDRLIPQGGITLFPAVDVYIVAITSASSVTLNTAPIVTSSGQPVKFHRRTVAQLSKPVSPIPPGNVTFGFREAVHPVPSIRSFSPLEVRPGDTVRVLGANFRELSVFGEVFVRDRYGEPIAASFRVQNDSTLDLCVPAAAGTGPIGVRNTKLTQTSLNSLSENVLHVTDQPTPVAGHAWSFAQESEDERSVSLTAPLNLALFRGPDTKLAHQDNIAASHIATMSNRLADLLSTANRVLIRARTIPSYPKSVDSTAGVAYVEVDPDAISGIEIGMFIAGDTFPNRAIVVDIDASLGRVTLDRPAEKTGTFECRFYDDRSPEIHRLVSREPESYALMDENAQVRVFRASPKLTGISGSDISKRSRVALVFDRAMRTLAVIPEDMTNYAVSPVPQAPPPDEWLGDYAWQTVHTKAFVNIGQKTLYTLKTCPVRVGMRVNSNAFPADTFVLSVGVGCEITVSKASTADLNAGVISFTAENALEILPFVPRAEDTEVFSDRSERVRFERRRECCPIGFGSENFLDRCSGADRPASFAGGVAQKTGVSLDEFGTALEFGAFLVPGEYRVSVAYRLRSMIEMFGSAGFGGVIVENSIRFNPGAGTKSMGFSIPLTPGAWNMNFRYKRNATSTIDLPLKIYHTADSTVPTPVETLIFDGLLPPTGVDPETIFVAVDSLINSALYGATTSQHLVRFETTHGVLTDPNGEFEILDFTLTRARIPDAVNARFTLGTTRGTPLTSRAANVALLDYRPDTLSFRVQLPLDSYKGRTQFTLQVDSTPQGPNQLPVPILFESIDIKRVEETVPTAFASTQGNWRTLLSNKTQRRAAEQYQTLVDSVTIAPEFRVIPARRNAHFEFRAEVLQPEARVCSTTPGQTSVAVSGVNPANFEAGGLMHFFFPGETPVSRTVTIPENPSTIPYGDKLPDPRGVIPDSLFFVTTNGILYRLRGASGNRDAEWIEVSRDGIPFTITVDPPLFDSGANRTGTVVPDAITVTSSAAPDIPGLTYDPKLALFSGIPTQSGLYTITVQTGSGNIIESTVLISVSNTAEPAYWTLDSTRNWMRFLGIVEPRITQAFRPSLAGDIGRPALVPRGLIYSDGRAVSDNTGRESSPTIVALQPWMISLGIFTANENFWNRLNL